MIISIVTWDANFRENLFTVDSFFNQNIDTDIFEFIWVDYYNSNRNVANKIKNYPRAKLITLDNPASDQWHIGKCINAGVKNSSGDIILLIDGDIIVDDNFLEHINKVYKVGNEFVTYFRRYDESIGNSAVDSKVQIKKMGKIFHLLSVDNFAGCAAVPRNLFQAINGYETHPAFAGPGMIAKEFYVRMKNFGAPIRWDRNKNVYHPWHPNTLGSGFQKELKEQIKILKWAKIDYPWLNPGRIEQSWIIHNRIKNLSYKSNENECANFLKHLPILLEPNLYKKYTFIANA